MNMYIGNEEVVCNKEINITEDILAPSKIILNNVYPKSWELTKDYTTNFYFPKEFSKFTMYDENNNLLFAGIVKNTGNIELNPRYPHYATVQVIDFKTFLSEGESLDFVIYNKTVEQAIQMVVDEIADYGFTLGDVDIEGKDDIIGTYNTQNQTAYDVLQYISEITQSKWFTKLIDEDTVQINFYDPDTMPEGTELEYTTEFFTTHNIMDIKYNYSTNDYRNKQVMLSNDVFASINTTETILADGYSQEFELEENIGKVISITENGVSKTFASNEEKEKGVVADYYYTIGSNILQSDDILSVGTTIVVEYTPIVKGRQVLYNNDEVDRIASQTNRKGVIARYEERNDVVSSSELQAVGESYLKYKGTSEIKLTVQTLNSNMWNVGEIVEWNDAPIPDLNKSYMVKKKTIQRIYAKDEIATFYTFELTSSYNTESAINYFDNQRRKSSGNIEEGKYIYRNYDIETEIQILFYGSYTNKETPTNMIDAVLDSVFYV